MVEPGSDEGARGESEGTSGVDGSDAAGEGTAADTGGRATTEGSTSEAAATAGEGQTGGEGGAEGETGGGVGETQGGGADSAPAAPSSTPATYIMYSDEWVGGGGFSFGGLTDVVPGTQLYSRDWGQWERGPDDNLQSGQWIGWRMQVPTGKIAKMACYIKFMGQIPDRSNHFGMR